MRDIVEAMRNGNERAQLAFEIFIHRLCACVGVMAARWVEWTYSSSRPGSAKTRTTFAAPRVSGSHSSALASTKEKPHS